MTKGAKTEWGYEAWHNNEFDKNGVGHPPCWAKDRVHGCDGGCRAPDFPGRPPRVGDIALCGNGEPGVILNADKAGVTYPDGNKALAWVGVHLSPSKAGQPWSSRNPCILGEVGDLMSGETIEAFVIRRKPAGWAEPR